MTEQPEVLDPRGACSRIVAVFDPLPLRLDGTYDAESRTLHLRGAVRASAELEEDVFAIFHELPFHLPLAPGQGLRYRLDLEACGDDALTQKLHDITIEAPVDALPDTGPLSRAQWDAWVSNVTYTLNGAPREVPAPDDFIEE